MHGSFSTAEIDIIQSLGLKAWAIYVFGNTTTLTDWNAWTTLIKDETLAYGFDGLILDDTQQIWYAAQNNGTVDDLTYYQWFCGNVSSNIVPTFGSDYTIVDVAGWGDNTDYDDMKTLDISDFIFTYYYYPSATIRYYAAYGPPTYVTNMSYSAWDIKTFFDNYHLNSYYQYGGWLWLEDLYASETMSTLGLIKTYNSIIDLAGNYTANNLFLYNVEQIYVQHRLRLEPIIRDIITAWKASTKLSTNKLTLEPFNEYYWTEEFTDGYFNNQTTVSDDGWQIVKGNENYTTTWESVSGDKILHIGYNGTCSLSQQHYTFERLISSTEMALHISSDFTIQNSSTIKDFILTGKHPHPWVYIMEFYGRSDRPIYWMFYNATKATETTVNVTSYTIGSSYNWNLYVNETSVQTSLSNSTWSWSYTVESAQIRYSSINLYSFIYSETINSYGNSSLDFTSIELDNVKVQPLAARNYVEITEWAQGKKEGTIKTANDLELYYSESGLPYDLSIYSYTFERDINFTQISDFSLKFNMTNINEDFVIRTGFAFWIPFEFIMGMFGLVGMIGFPMFMISKAKRKEFADMGWMFAGACISAALFFAWLWLA